MDNQKIPEIQHILVDWGGVLAPRNVGVVSRTLAKKYKIDPQQLLHDIIALASYYFHESSSEKFFDDLAEKFSIDRSEIVDLFTVVKPWAVFDLVKQLAQKYPVSLLSNQIATRTKAIREQTDLSFFKHIFFSDEVGLAKPEPEIFQHALKIIDEQPEHVLFIDDLPANTKTARDLGIHTIVFLHQEQLVTTLKEKFGITT